MKGDTLLESQIQENVLTSQSQPTAVTKRDIEKVSEQEEQELYWQAYRLQQARRFCPGCGDDGVVY